MIGGLTRLRRGYGAAGDSDRKPRPSSIIHRSSSISIGHPEHEHEDGGDEDLRVRTPAATPKRRMPNMFNRGNRMGARERMVIVRRSHCGQAKPASLSKHCGQGIAPE